MPLSREGGAVGSRQALAVAWFVLVEPSEPGSQALVGLAWGFEHDSEGAAGGWGGGVVMLGLVLDPK